MAGPLPHLFDRWSATYDNPTLQRSTYDPVHDAVLGAVSALEPSAVLDLGCGTGRLTAKLAGRFPAAIVVGLDLSSGMLARAASDGRIGWVRGDAAHLPLAQGSIDLVTCTESFHWYQDQQRALAETHRVLSPEGRLTIASIATVTPLGTAAAERLSRLAGSPLRPLSPGRLQRLLHLAGFAVIAQRRIVRRSLVPWPVLTVAERR